MKKLDCRQLYSWQKIVFVKKKKKEKKMSIPRVFVCFLFLGFRESYSLSTLQLFQSQFGGKGLHYRCGDTHHGKMDFTR